MKALLFMFGLITAPLFADSLDSWKDRVAKVQSEQFQGSGALLPLQNNRIGLMTSEHVLRWLQDTSYSVRTRKIQSTAEENINSYLHGLALMSTQVRDDQIGDKKFWLREDSATGVTDLSKLEFYALGYPAGSQEIRVVGPGYLHEKNSRRAFIPMSKGLYELRNLPVEFGMSGGVLLVKVADSDYRFAGMLSHQFLKRQGGKVTVPSEVSATNAMAPTDLTFAIPFDQIDSWYQQIPNLNKEYPTFNRILNPQTSEASVVYGKLNLRVLHLDLNRSHSSSVGGLIVSGGADGSGVGGNEVASTFENPVIEIKSRPTYNEDMRSEMQPFYEATKNGRTLYVLGMVDGNKQMHVVNSVEEFLTYLLRDRYHPVWVKGTEEGLDRAVTDLQIKAEKIREAIARILLRNPSGSARVWLKKIRDDALLMDNLLIERESFKKYLEPSHDTVWQILVLDDFDSATELETRLIDMVGE